jgi:lipoprotein NlpD
MFSKKTISILICVMLLLTACSAHFRESTRASGVYHKVKENVTLWRIAQTYNTDLQELAEINNITDPSVIKAGSIIFIPNAAEVLEIKPPIHQLITPPTPTPTTSIKPPRNTVIKKETRTKEKRKKETVRFERSRFIWPIEGTLLSKFGIQPNGMRYNGIEIKAKEGTPVLASASGRIIHSSSLKYYGETIIIKHKNNYSTVYTFLKNRCVSVGDSVKKGEKIALLGKNKKNGKNCLHFEIRRSNKPKNPLFYLPKSKSGKTGKRKK